MHATTLITDHSRRQNYKKKNNYRKESAHKKIQTHPISFFSLNSGIVLSIFLFATRAINMLFPSWLVVSTRKIWVSWDDDSKYVGKNIFQTTNQICYVPCPVTASWQTSSSQLLPEQLRQKAIEGLLRLQLIQVLRPRTGRVSGRRVIWGYHGLNHGWIISWITG